jgi:hypothetical protein
MAMGIPNDTVLQKLYTVRIPLDCTLQELYAVRKPYVTVLKKLCIMGESPLLIKIKC